MRHLASRRLVFLAACTSVVAGLAALVHLEVQDWLISGMLALLPGIPLLILGRSLLEAAPGQAS